MSSRDLIEDLVRGRGLTLEELASVIAKLDRRDPEPSEEEAGLILGLIGEEEDVHDTTGPKPNSSNQSKNEYFDGLHIRGYHRKVPQNVTPCPLSETIIDQGIDLSTGMTGDFSKKFGGGIKPHNASYITVTDHSSLHPTDEFSVAFYVYIPATASGDKKQFYFDKTGLRLFIEEHDIVSNTIKASVIVGGTEHIISYQFMPNAWYHVVLSVKSPNFRMYFDKTLVASTTALSGTIGTSSDGLRLFNRAFGVLELNGGGKLLLSNGGRLRLNAPPSPYYLLGLHTGSRLLLNDSGRLKLNAN